MRTLWGAVAMVVLGCSERPPPPAVAPPVVAQAIDSGPPAEPFDAGVIDERPNNVLQQPETDRLAEDFTLDDQLAQALLRDPALVEKRLAAAPTPSSWQVALIANFALRRGDKTLVPPKENPLPEVTFDGGVDRPGPAWVGVVDLPLKRSLARGKPSPTVTTLPLATEVSVEAVDGGIAFIAVPLATSVTFASREYFPTQVETTTVRGQVPARSLLATALRAEDLRREAKAQPATEAGLDRAIALWHLAFTIDHGDLSREGWLKAAIAARRSWWTVEAALQRTYGPAGRLALAYQCRGDPAKASWARWPLPKSTSPDNRCLTNVSEQGGCDEDPPKLRRRLDEDQLARKAAGLELKPVLRLTVDARTVRNVFLAASKLELIDGCGDFPQLKVDSWGAALRRLPIPLGVAGLPVFVEVPGYHGMEYSVISASSELKAATWLRSRGHPRWTLGRNGELEPSLSQGDNGFRLEPDVQAASLAVAPVRPCTCDD